MKMWRAAPSKVERTCPGFVKGDSKGCSLMGCYPQFEEQSHKINFVQKYS